jgi:DNA uptake protein ComE-like DNA-binding protein
MDLLFIASVVTYYFEKTMWKHFVKDYLCFSKKERNAVLVLLLLIVLLWVLPMVWPDRQFSKTDSREIAKMEAELRLAKEARSIPNSGIDASDNPRFAPEANTGNFEKGTLFYFNPNTLDAAGWRRLGIKERTIRTISNYIAKAGRFRKPDDLLKIYGFGKMDFKRLQPYIQLDTVFRNGSAGNIKIKAKSGQASLAHYRSQPAFLKPIEINTADSTDFIGLPGIGNKLAARIIHFRDKLGGFSSVDQLAETYALPDSTFRKILPRLYCNTSSIKKIAINKADVFTLQQHPYVRKYYASVIFKYRQQHGNFKQASDLLQIHLLNDRLINKLLPYLDFE